MKNWLMEHLLNGNFVKIVFLTVALLSIITTGFLVFNKLFISPTKVKIEYEIKQSFISIIKSHQESINDKMCISFYDLKIIGLKENATSIKVINYYIKSKGKWIQGNYVGIKIQNYKDKNGDETPCIVLGNDMDMVVVMGWTEITEFYNKRIEYSEVLAGSAIYYFDLTQQEIYQASKMKFIITDNFNRKYTYKSKMELTNVLEKNMCVFDFYVPPPPS